MAKFKQKCYKCKTNYVLVGPRDRFPVCYECDKKAMEGELKDPAMKKMFDIPEEFYKENSFLRDIKKKALEYQDDTEYDLTERQIEAFKETVQRMTEAAKESKKEENKEKEE